MRLEQFDGWHDGEDVWLVGSDASLAHFPPGFFWGRTVIGVNAVCRRIPTTYTITKADRNDETDWLAWQVFKYPAVLTFCSKHQEGYHALPQVNVPGVVMFDHYDNPTTDFDPNVHIPDDPNMLLVSQTTGGSGMHLAARMRARTVFCVGLSGGKFGGNLQDPVYWSPGINGHTDKTTVRVGARQMQGIADALHRKYGTVFVTVLPWANMQLGGTTFRSDYGTLN